MYWQPCSHLVAQAPKVLWYQQSPGTGSFLCFLGALPGAPPAIPLGAGASAGGDDDGDDDEVAPSSPTLTPVAATGDNESVTLDERGKLSKFKPESKEWANLGVGAVRIFTNDLTKRCVCVPGEGVCVKGGARSLPRPYC